MQYYELIPLSGDMAYIEKIANELDIDYTDAEIYINTDKISNYDITNQIIYYVIYEGINNLDLPNKYKEELQDSIYTNCMDSGIDIDIDKFPKKYRKTIEDFSNLL